MEKETTIARYAELQMGIFFLLFASLTMVLCEARVINELWFQSAGHISWRKFPALIFMLLPALYGWVLEVLLRGLTRKGEVTSGSRAAITLWLGILLFLTYMGFFELAGFAS